MTAAVEGRYGVVRQRRVSETALASDTFTESTNMPLQNHTPDSGGRSWVTSTTDAWLLEGTSGATSVNIASRVWARWGTGLADDAFTLQGEITRGPADGSRDPQPFPGTAQFYGRGGPNHHPRDQPPAQCRGNADHATHGRWVRR